MKNILFLFVIVTFGLSSCKDQINTPQSGSNGERIVFTALDYSFNPVNPHVIIADSSGANQKDLGYGYIFDAGQKNIFWYTGDSATQAYSFHVSDNTGSNGSLLNLTNPHEEFHDLYGFTISPDGSKVLYPTYDTVAKTDNLYIMNTDGSGKRLLSPFFDHQTYACFSTDGNQVAYYRKFDDSHTLKETIEIINTNGSSRYTLTAVTDGMVDGGGSIAWSKKNVIAYVDEDTLFTISSNGTGRIQLGLGFSPSWSPTGDTLAYANDDIILTTNNGLTNLNVTNSPGIYEGWPHWSSDGKRLLVTRWVGHFDTTLLTLEELTISSMAIKIIASPGAFGYYVN